MQDSGRKSTRAGSAAAWGLVACDSAQCTVRLSGMYVDASATPPQRWLCPPCRMQQNPTISTIKNNAQTSRATFTHLFGLRCGACPWHARIPPDEGLEKCSALGCQLRPQDLSPSWPPVIIVSARSFSNACLVHVCVSSDDSMTRPTGTPQRYVVVFRMPLGACYDAYFEAFV